MFSFFGTFSADLEANKSHHSFPLVTKDSLSFTTTFFELEKFTVRVN